MRVLLDACTFLWAALEPEKLSVAAAALIAEPSNEVYLSVASAWEVCVKESRGTLLLKESSVVFIPKYREQLDYLELPLDEIAVLHLSTLPPIHKDPFDRMLVCQAIAHGMTIVTPDPKIAKYPVRVVW